MTVLVLYGKALDFHFCSVWAEKFQTCTPKPPSLIMPMFKTAARHCQYESQTNSKPIRKLLSCADRDALHTSGTAEEGVCVCVDSWLKMACRQWCGG